MAVVGCCTSVPSQSKTMHPFFRPVCSKGISLPLKQHTSELREPAEQAAVEQGFVQHGNTTQTGSGGFGDILNRTNRQDGYEHNEDNEYVENLEIDPNIERRKRQKIATSESSEPSDSPVYQTPAPEATGGDGSWLAQLQAAANCAGAQSGSHTAEPKVPPPTTPSGSPIKLAIRQSPTKTPRKPELAIDTPVSTPPSISRRTTRSSSSAGKIIPSPTTGPTPKKVIKLTSKGKLLSSPPSVSQALKRSIKSKASRKADPAAPTPRKIICMRYGVEHESRERIGSQINTILSQTSNASVQLKASEPSKVTHPFFTGKPAQTGNRKVILTDDGPINGELSDADERIDSVVLKPKDWNDLGFKKNKTCTVKVVDAILPLWPPKGMQHIGVADVYPVLQQNYQPSAIRQRSSKSRKELLGVSDDENILRRYTATLEYHRGQLRDAFPLPGRIILTRLEMVGIVTENMSNLSSSSRLRAAYPEAFERMRRKILSNSTSTHLGIPGIAQSWLSKSAPTEICHVLQPQSNLLRSWLANHQVHHTARKISGAPKVQKVRKRRRKKKAEELDDFIVTSDDEDGDSSATKNALLITGPNGCGKTASVYAAAKELGFEVFEIHPGMRRSAKDIFDKVGDMTQNHLVQKAAQLDQTRESTPETALDTSNSESGQGSKNAMKSFLKGDKPGKSGKSQPGTPQIGHSNNSQSRKQSLILFEEVDILFEEDRGFWSGVIQLIEQSKRPAVLTCNDLRSIPVGDLPLHATLEYDQVSTGVAVDYILLLAAAEGHCLEREAVHSLYLAKNMDLRATITELEFWCQMAVGSEKAGLDWIIDRRSNAEMDTDVNLYSKDTYRTGMGLIPRTMLVAGWSKYDSILQHAQEELGTPLEWWLDEDARNSISQSLAEQYNNLSTVEELQEFHQLAEARSVLDLLNNAGHTYNDMAQMSNEVRIGNPAESSDTERVQQGAICAELAASILAVRNPEAPRTSLTDIAFAHLQTKDATPLLTQGMISAAFEPLMVEKPQFPPSFGRLAPSLDTFSMVLMSDIAPYARSIVRYDQRLQEQRQALAGGSQTTKVRKTRAARAALEGGNKATTREEKWFPKKTDYAAVLRTGGTWASCEDESAWPSSSGTSEGNRSRTGSIAPSPADDVVMSDGA